MENMIRVSGIVNDSIVDGPGFRYVIFSQGCNHKCKGCHNPHTHSEDGGYWIDIDQTVNEIEKNKLLDGVTFSGGEPFLQAKKFVQIAKRIKILGLSIVTYTGFTFETLLELGTEENGWLQLLELTDILVDGQYIEEQRSLMLKFRGSKNQRIIDIPKSIYQQSAVNLEV